MGRYLGKRDKNVGTGVSSAQSTRYQKEKPLSVPAPQALPMAAAWTGEANSSPTTPKYLFEPSLQLLAQRGRQIEIAAATQPRVSFNLRDFYHREARLFGVDSLQLTVSAASALLAKLKAGFETGAFRPSPIAKTYTLAQGQQAYEDVLHGGEGKVVLVLR